MIGSPVLRAVRDLPVSRRVTVAPPARSLEDAVRLCDPFMPLDPMVDVAIRKDLSPLRGGDRLGKIMRHVLRAGGTPTLHFVTGHPGSGKTTELLRIKQRLETPAVAGAESAIVFWLDADALLSRTEVDLEDVMVGLWTVVTDQAPSSPERLKALWSEKVYPQLAPLCSNLPSELRDGLQHIGEVLRLAGTEQRVAVRKALGATMSLWLEGLNQTFAALRHKASSTTSIVVLIDNLEKLSHRSGSSIDPFYVERLGALKELDAHLVITVPLHLCYALTGARWVALYGAELVALPVIKVRRRASEGAGDDWDGVAAMAELLRKRVDFGRLFEGPETAAEIARLSGGCIRHALRMVQGAINEQDSPPISAESIQRAASALQADFERALPEAWVPELRVVAKTNCFAETCPEEVKRELVRHLFVLEYQNGEPEPWYAVHPLVERCRKYRELSHA